MGGWGGSFLPSGPSVLPSVRPVRPVRPPGPSARSFRPVLPPGPSARSVRPVLPWWVGGRGPFAKSTIFNCFRHNKSEPDLKDDCFVTVFLNFLPNRFCFKLEPHELVWKSVTAILHSFFVSIFMIFFKLFKNGTRFPDFSYSRPKKCVSGPGDVLACPRIYRFVYQSANAPQTLSDPPQKLIVHTFPSIWQ